MAEYINREAFVVAQRKWYCENCVKRQGVKNGKKQFVYEMGDVPCRACEINDVLSDLEDYPAADVVEVKHGKWVYNDGDNIPYCSECLIPQDMPCNYCPECGAEMEC